MKTVRQNPMPWLTTSEEVQHLSDYSKEEAVAFVTGTSAAAFHRAVSERSAAEQQLFRSRVARR